MGIPTLRNKYKMEQLIVPAIAIIMLIGLCIFAPTEHSAEYIIKKAIKDREKMLKRLDKELKK